MTTKPPTLTAPTWRSWILQAAPLPLIKDEHPWLCYTYNEKNVRVCVYSPEKYREECSKNSFWKTHCEKIPLKGIIAIAQKVKINSFTVPEELTHNLLLGRTDIFQGTPDDFVNEYFQKLEAECAEIQNTVTALENMCTRSQQKKERLKTQSVWSRVMLYLCSWLYSSPEVKELRISNVPATLLQLKQNMLDDACQKIKYRISVNIGGFEEEIPFENRIHPNSDPVINEPKDVTKLLSRYAQDKMPNVNKRANEYRIRFIALYKIWQALVKKRGDLSANSSPINTTPDLQSLGSQQQKPAVLSVTN